MQFDEFTWYFGLSPFGPKTPTPSFYRTAIKDLRAFNDRLEKCDAVLDARADNLLQFIDRIANDLGATSAILRDRSEKYDSGWFDTRADDRFWFAYGQLYGYYGILSYHKYLTENSLIKSVSDPSGSRISNLTRRVPAYRRPITPLAKSGHRAPHWSFILCVRSPWPLRHNLSYMPSWRSSHCDD